MGKRTRGFAEWLNERYVPYLKNSKILTWKEMVSDGDDIGYTTAQLYQLFKQRPAEGSGEKEPDQKGLEWLHNPHIEFCYRDSDGGVQVRYRRIEGTPECTEMMAEVDKLIEKTKPAVSPYFYRKEEQKEVKP